ncbi:MAG: hypothetical protein HY698_14075 [Deltaproteobacteria bacterium]|nr:hypothetical protein [Deltaproteobacteria bacterium]
MILAGLEVQVIGGTDGRGSGDGPVVILLHGFGAPGNDLVPLASVLRIPRARFIFPAAPLLLETNYFGESRAWWMIDQERIEQDLATGRPRDRSKEHPAGLPEARRQIVRLLSDTCRMFEVPSERIALGGFSQGAMLACDVALRTDMPLAGLILLSGTLICEDEWTDLMPKRARLPIFQSHGASDRLLPFSSAVKLRDLWTSQGARVDWVEFPGEHEIPIEVLTQLATYLYRIAGQG